MPTYLVTPPPPQQRMSFMDALESAGIDYERQPDGYFVYLREGQGEVWEQLCQRFHLIVEEAPPSLPGGSFMD